MRLFELVDPKGTYAGVKFDDATKKAITNYTKLHNIPKPLSEDKLHTTLLYSRKYLPEYKPAGEYEKPLIGKPSSFDVWSSQPDDDGKVSRCLVLRYDCPELVERHESLMDEHGATYDYDEYHPHVTLSYDIGSFSIDDLPMLDDDVVIVHEYGEDLNLNWAKSNS